MIVATRWSEFGQTVRERHVAHPVRQQPTIVIAGDADHVGGGQQTTAHIDVAGPIGNVAGATHGIDALSDQMRERGIEPPVFGMNVTDQSKPSNARTHESSRSTIERVYASPLVDSR